jgi:hypothetical protein
MESMDVARKLQLKSAATVAVVDLPAGVDLALGGAGPDGSWSALRFRPGSR